MITTLGLVLLFVQSAFGAPSVAITQSLINDIAPLSNPGRLVSSYLTDRAFEIVDGGDTNIYILTIQQILNDLANQPDQFSQALAVAQTIAILGELATGTPGDSCTYANVIDAFASGNSAALSQAMSGLSARLSANIDLITNLANDPDSQRYAVGEVGGCLGGGRSYRFQAAWNSVLSYANAYQIGLINEEYCSAKRLYAAFNSRTNNVGAALTAVSVKPVAIALQKSLVPAANFLHVVVSGENPAQAGAVAKAAINSALSSV